MIKVLHTCGNLFLVIVLLVCTACAAWPQDTVSISKPLPVVIDRKQAEALLVTQSPPEYPPVAKINYVEGQVQLELTVNNKGKVANAHVLDGMAILAESALNATHGWLYRPLRTASGPSGFITTVRVRFNLKTRGTELTARQAERDFLRQVKPALAIRPPGEIAERNSVHVRLLVNNQGQIVDMGTSPTDKARFETAREILQGWTFRPARWGTLPIASYLEVDVPVGTPCVARAAADILIR